MARGLSRTNVLAFAARRGGDAELGDLFGHAVEERVVGLAEELDSFYFELSGQRVQVDPDLAKRREDGARLGNVFLRGVAPHLAVVAEGVDRLGWHRVDGVGSDELLDVEHVAARRVLHTRARPERTLKLGL